LVTYVAKLSKVGLNLLIADLCGQTADKDLAMAGLGLLGVDLLAVDYVLIGGADLVNGLGVCEHDEGESSGPSGLGICLDIDALDLTIFAKVIAQFL